jgi:hypothetical protein
MLADAQMIKQIEIYQSMGYKFSDESSEGSNRLFPTESLYAKMASVAFKFKLIFQGITDFSDSNRQFLFGDMSFFTAYKAINDYHFKYMFSLPVEDTALGIEHVTSITSRRLSDGATYLGIPQAEAAIYDAYETMRATALSSRGDVINGVSVDPISSFGTNGFSVNNAIYTVEGAGIYYDFRVKDNYRIFHLGGQNGQQYTVKVWLDNGDAKYEVRPGQNNEDGPAIASGSTDDLPAAKVKLDAFAHGKISLNELNTQGNLITGQGWTVVSAYSSLTAAQKAALTPQRLKELLEAATTAGNTTEAIQIAWQLTGHTTFGDILGTAIGASSSFINVGGNVNSAAVSGLFNIAGSLTTSLYNNNGTILKDDLESAGTNFVSGLVSAAIINATGLKGIPGQLVGTLATSLVSSAITSLISSTVLSTSDVLQSAGNAVGSAIGNILGNKVVPANSPAGAVVSAVVNLIIRQIITAMFSSLGPIGTIVGLIVSNFISTVIGNLITNLFGGGKKNPLGVTDIGIDADGKFVVLGSGTNNGGSAELTKQIAAAAVDSLNGFVAMVGGKVINIEDITGLRYGYESSKGGTVYFVGPDANLKENHFHTVEEALDYGVLRELRGTLIEGGNVYVKRGLYSSDATTRADLGADVTTALRYAYYQAYKDADPLKLMDFAKEGNFSWDQVLKDAATLPLDVPHPADHYSRVNYLASRLGSDATEEIILGKAVGFAAPKLDIGYKLTADERHNAALYEQLVKEGRIEVETKAAVQKTNPNTVLVPETKAGEVFVDGTWRKLAATFLDSVNHPQPKSTVLNTRAPLELGQEGDNPDAIVQFTDTRLQSVDFWQTAAGLGNDSSRKSTVIDVDTAPAAPSDDTKTAMLAGAVAAIALTRSPVKGAQASDLFDTTKGIEVAGGNLWQDQSTGALNLIGRALADIDVGSRHDWTQANQTVTDKQIASQNDLAALEAGMIYVTENALAYDEKITSTEDRVLKIDQDLLTANDLGNIGDYLIIKQVGNAVNGQVSVQNGQVTFIPDHDFHGEAQFDYIVEDGHGGVSMATARINFGAENDTPVVTGELFNSYQNTTLSISAAELLGNDWDVDGDGLKITGVEGAMFDGDTIYFTPQANFSGVTGFHYTVTDGSGDTVRSYAAVTVQALANGEKTVVLNQTRAANSVNRPVTTTTKPEPKPVSAADAAKLKKQKEDRAKLEKDLADARKAIPKGTVKAVQLSQALKAMDGEMRYSALSSLSAGTRFWLAVRGEETGAFTNAAAFTAFMAAGTAAAGAPKSVSFLGSEFSRDEKGAITSSSSVLYNSGAVGPVRTAPQVHYVTGADIVSQQVDLSQLAALNPLLPGVALTVQNANAQAAASTLGRMTVLFDSPAAVQAAGLAAAQAAPTVVDGPDVALFTGRDTALSLDLDALGLAPGARILSVSSGAGGAASVDADGVLRFTPTSGYTGTGSFELLVTDASGQIISTSARVTVLPTATGTASTFGTATSTTTTGAATTADLISLTTTTTATTTGTSTGTTTTGTSTGTSTNTTTTLTTATLTTVTGTATTTDTTSSQTADANLGAGGNGNVVPPVDVTPAPPAPPPPPPGVRFSVDTLVQAGLGGNGGTLTVSSIAGASHGTATINADGSVQFIAASGYTGPTTLTLTLSDGHGGSFTLPVTVDSATGAAVTPSAPAATATPMDVISQVDDLAGGTDGVTGTEDRGIVLTAADLLANDPISADPDVPAPTLTDVHSAVGGTVTLAADGSIRFIPDANATGPASFAYDTTDADGVVTTHTVEVAITAVNDAPVVTTAPLAGIEDTALTVTAATLAGRISDVDGDAVTVTEVTALLGGTATLAANGDLQFTPHANFNGTGLVQITVDDGQGGVTTSLQTLAVQSVNDAPTAIDPQAATGTEDTQKIFTAAELLAGAADVDGDTLAVAAVANAVGGTATVGANGSVTFTPDANHTGAAGFNYTVSDGNGGTTTARVDLTLAAVNDAPTGGATLATDEDTALTVDLTAVRAGDADVEGDAFSFQGLGAVRHGTLVENADGTVTFTPTANFHGVAGFDYKLVDEHGAEGTATVTINVASVNDAPTAADHGTTINEDTPVLVTQASLLTGAADVEGSPLSVTAVAGATGGVATLGANGNVTFTPDANYHGAAGFDYTVSDGQGGTTTAHVAIDVTSVNDAPTGGATLATNEDTALIVDLDAIRAGDSDVEGDAITFGGVTQVHNGALTTNADGTLTFTPDANFHGQAGFDYKLTDAEGGEGAGRVVINVASVNDAPVLADHSATITEDTPVLIAPASLLAGSADVEGDALSVASVGAATGGTVSLDAQGRVLFTPDADYAGAAGFDYTVSDGQGGTSTAHVVLDVTAVNDAPRSLADLATFDEDTSFTFQPADLIANDYDVEGDGFNFVPFFTASHGTVTEGADGSVTFTPDADYFGTAGFSYRVTDSHGASSDIHVALTVAGVNDAPVVADDSFSFNEDTVALFTKAALFANDFDVDGDTLSIASVQDAVGGVASVTAGGDVRFTPFADFNGPAGFTYTVSDGHGATATAAVALDILAVNDAPRMTNVTYAATEEVPLTLDPNQLLADAAAYDVDGDGFDFTGITGVTGGTITTEADGTLTFAPTENFFGQAQISYTTTDSEGAVGTGQITLNVANVQDVPVAQDNAFALQEDQNAQFTHAALTGNDSDADGDVLTIASVGNVQGGTASVSGGGVSFIPTADYNGSAGFDYTISDGHGNTSTARVDLTIAAVNDAPRLQSDWLGSALEEQPISVAVASLMSNDVDPEGDAMTFLGVSGASGGTVSQSGGTVNFTPYTNFNGTASFTYQVADAQGAVSSTTAAYQVINVNDVPIAAGETIYGQEDQVQYIAASLLTQNDYDADGDALSILSAYGASHGTVYASGAGVVYVPQANYYGTDQFTYTVSDGRGGTANATAYLNIASVNDAPTGFGEQLSPMAQGSTLNQSFASLLANDSDPDGDALTISSASSNYGSAYASGGSVFFTPYPNITGSASFNYTVSDGRGGMIEETAQVDVMSTNRAPVITATAITGTPVNIEGNYTPYYFGTVTASDPDGDALKMQASSSIGMMIAPENPYQGNFIWQWYPPSYANGLSANLNFTVSDQGGLSATTTVHITTLWQTPIILDVSGQGLSLLNAAQSGVSTSIFDQTATGTTAWIGAGNAFLALDDDGDGAISANDIIFTDDAPGAETDMDAVQQAYDTSGSGTLDQADTRFADFRVWEDRNQDGIADQAEVQTLADAGIASVGLTGARDDQTMNGSIVHRTSEFTRTDGTTGTAADVSLGAISVTTSVGVTPTATSTSTVLHSLPNAVPVATTQAQAVTTVVTAPTAVTPQATTLPPVQTHQVSQTQVTSTSAVVAALPEAQMPAASVEAATSLVLADTATTVAAVTVAAASEGQTAATPSVSAVTESADQTPAVPSSVASAEEAVTSGTSGATGIDTPVTTPMLPEMPAVTSSGGAVSSSAPTAVTPVTTASAETTGSGPQTATDIPATPAAAALPAPVTAIDTAPPASTTVDLTANIANQADLLRQAMAAFDPAPSVAAAASATDMLTQTATLAANPISAGDQGDTKLAA